MYWIMREFQIFYETRKIVEYLLTQTISIYFHHLNLGKQELDFQEERKLQAFQKRNNFKFL